MRGIDSVPHDTNHRRKRDSTRFQRSAEASAKPHAMSSARSASSQRVGAMFVITEPILSRRASATWSKFNAHAVGIPSSTVRYDLRGDSADGSRRGNDENLVEAVDDGVASQ